MAPRMSGDVSQARRSPNRVIYSTIAWLNIPVQIKQLWHRISERVSETEKSNAHHARVEFEVQFESNWMFILRVNCSAGQLINLIHIKPQRRPAALTEKGQNETQD